MSRILEASKGKGHHKVFSVGDGGVRWLGLETIRLAPGETWRGELKDEEAALVILGGRASIAVANGTESKWDGLGRADIRRPSGRRLRSPPQSARSEG
jgi:5-deoxy-D-glucuronate isomerase